MPYDASQKPRVSAEVREHIEAALSAVSSARKSFESAGYNEWSEMVFQSSRPLAKWLESGNFMDCFDAPEVKD